MGIEIFRLRSRMGVERAVECALSDRVGRVLCSGEVSA